MRRLRGCRHTSLGSPMRRRSTTYVHLYCGTGVSFACRTRLRNTRPLFLTVVHQPVFIRTSLPTPSPIATPPTPPARAPRRHASQVDHLYADVPLTSAPLSLPPRHTHFVHIWSFLSDCMRPRAHCQGAQPVAWPRPSSHLGRSDRILPSQPSPLAVAAAWQGGGGQSAPHGNSLPPQK